MRKEREGCFEAAPPGKTRARKKKMCQRQKREQVDLRVRAVPLRTRRKSLKCPGWLLRVRLMKIPGPDSSFNTCWPWDHKLWACQISSWMGISMASPRGCQDEIMFTLLSFESLFRNRYVPNTVSGMGVTPLNKTECSISRNTVKDKGVSGRRIWRWLCTEGWWCWSPTVQNWLWKKWPNNFHQQPKRALADSHFTNICCC